MSLTCLGRLALACMALSACSTRDFYDPCFTPASVVSGERVLAIRTDPPQPVVDLTGDQPVSVRVRALVAKPVSNWVRVTACVLAAPPQGRSDQVATDCASTGPTVVALASDPGAVDLQLSIPMELLRQSLQADPLHGFGGVRALLKFETEQGVPAVSTKELVFARPGEVPNHGLELSSVETWSGGVRLGTLGRGDLLQLQKGTLIGLRPVPSAGLGAAAAAEEYDVVDLSGQRRHLRESLSYSIYNQQGFLVGDLPKNGAGQPVGTYRAQVSNVGVEPAPGVILPDGILRLNAIRYPASSLVWVVARDGRGAVAWTEFSVAAVDPGAGYEGPDQQPFSDFGCD